MRNATLIVHSPKGDEIAEIAIEDIAPETTEAALRRHYDKMIMAFMRQLGAGAHVGKVVWE